MLCLPCLGPSKYIDCQEVFVNGQHFYIHFQYGEMEDTNLNNVKVSICDEGKVSICEAILLISQTGVDSSQHLSPVD